MYKEMQHEREKNMRHILAETVGHIHFDDKTEAAISEYLGTPWQGKGKDLYVTVTPADVWATRYLIQLAIVDQEPSGTMSENVSWT